VVPASSRQRIVWESGISGDDCTSVRQLDRQAPLRRANSSRRPRQSVRGGRRRWSPPRHFKSTPTVVLGGLSWPARPVIARPPNYLPGR
jgi:hypothetical protein